MKQPPMVVRLATSDLIMMSVLIALLMHLFNRIEKAYGRQPQKVRHTKNELKELVRAELPAIGKRVQANVNNYALFEDEQDAAYALELEREPHE